MCINEKFFCHDQNPFSSRSRRSSSFRLAINVGFSSGWPTVQKSKSRRSHSDLSVSDKALYSPVVRLKLNRLRSICRSIAEAKDLKMSEVMASPKLPCDVFRHDVVCDVFCIASERLVGDHNHRGGLRIAHHRRFHISV